MDTHTTLLFFPGSRPELLAKAVASGAGAVCVDLEDSVAPGDKASARDAAMALLSDPGRPQEMAVRINHPDTTDGERDLGALADAAEAGEVTVMIPKVSGPEEVARVTAALHAGRAPAAVIAVIETARGLHRVEDIATSDGVVGLLFGALDLSTELGCQRGWDNLLYARSRCVVAARLGGVALLDSPWFEVDDADGLRSEARRARELGFTGKAAIHPSQVAVIQEVFSPDDEELAQARRVVTAAEETDEGVFLLDGSMVDRPVVEAARRLIARAKQET